MAYLYSLAIRFCSHTFECDFSSAVRFVVFARVHAFLSNAVRGSWLHIFHTQLKMIYHFGLKISIYFTLNSSMLAPSRDFTCSSGCVCSFKVKRRAKRTRLHIKRLVLIVLAKVCVCYLLVCISSCRMQTQCLICLLVTCEHFSAPTSISTYKCIHKNESHAIHMKLFNRL